MTRATHGGKGDRIPGTNDAAYQENYPVIDWNARERAKGCPLCGSTGVHACAGHPPRAWTEQEKADCLAAMNRIRDREAQA